MKVSVLGGRIVAALALVVLLGASLLPIADAEAAGWRHDHGHITLGGVVPDHDHPWERGGRGGPARSGEHHHDHADAGGGEAHAEVVFIFDDDGTPSVMPALGPLLSLLPGSAREVEVVPAQRLAGVAVGVEAPPPRL
ncbi:MAG: hypothetical protein M0R73_06965 [Dehalococcoidia bacterium]|nr:hypothetical protein [Dehalococcoidia bacterium]